MGFECQRCGNQDPASLGVGPTGNPYCRLCLPFQGKTAGPYVHQGDPIRLELGYPLSLEQSRVSKAILSSIQKNRPVLVSAVTGAGKTELVYESMALMLSNRKQVGFAIPRHDVVLELGPRIQAAFPKAKVVTVCEGHTEDLTGDIVVLTAHQLYRYPKYFDLLVFDEIDAFPYKGNRLLNRFFRDSLRGTYVLLSATPSLADIRNVTESGGTVISLSVRYHGKPLPVPSFVPYRWLPQWDIAHRLKGFLDRQKPVFLFVPTIAKARSTATLLSHWFPKGTSVDSKDPKREAKIAEFKAGKLDYLVCTSVLERGVTVPDLQVMVLDSDHPVFDASALVQIAGRAGRKKGHEDGTVLFYGWRKEPHVEEAIETIERLNASAKLQGLL